MALNRSVGQSTNDAPGFRDDAADAHKLSTIATERSGRRALQPSDAGVSRQMTDDNFFSPRLSSIWIHKSFSTATAMVLEARRKRPHR
jgi:hypothetical protein